MPGSDEGGYAGFNDKVDTHFWKVWGNALFMSALSAGIQLSQGNAAATNGSLNTTQTIAAATGQQLGQLGMEMARRNMQAPAHARNPSRLSLYGHGYERHRAAPLDLARRGRRALIWRRASARKTGPCSRFAAPL